MTSSKHWLRELRFWPTHQYDEDENQQKSDKEAFVKLRTKDSQCVKPDRTQNWTNDVY